MRMKDVPGAVAFSEGILFIGPEKIKISSNNVRLRFAKTSLGTRTIRPTLEFYEGKCQETYFPAELNPGEASSGIQPLVCAVLVYVVM
jgi:hypothetical protein